MKLSIKKGRMPKMQTSFQLSITIAQKNYLKSSLFLIAAISGLTGVTDLRVQ